MSCLVKCFAGILHYVRHFTSRVRSITTFFKNFLVYQLSMSKRSAIELETSSKIGEPYSKASGSGHKRENVTMDEMGEFEDAWEDEIESDEEVIDAEVQDEDGVFIGNLKECEC